MGRSRGRVVRRWVGRGVACAVLGVVTTVGVAWGLAVWLPHGGLEGRGEWGWRGTQRMSPLGNRYPSHAVTEFSRPGMARRCWNVGGAKIRTADSDLWLLPERVNQSDGFRWFDVVTVPDHALRRHWGALREAERASDEGGSRYGIEDARGWPMLALWYSVTVSDPAKVTFHGTEAGISAAGCSGGLPISPQGTHVGEFRALPLRPIWSGLLGNTAVYAAAWGVMLFVPRGVRGHLRWRRGACVRCAYDLTEVREPGCPECGAGRKGAA